MQRNAILELLKSYSKESDAAAEISEKVSAFVKQHPNCCDRSLGLGHLTGSAWLLNHDLSKVLLTHHRKLNRWLQLGGHADGSADLLAVATKEAQEESGIFQISAVSTELFDLDIHEIPATKTETAHMHYDFRFLLKTDTNEDFKVSNESNALSWYTAGEISGLATDPSVIRMKDKWVKFLSNTICCFHK